jgi:crossover junction endonuclease EME1
MPEVIDLLTPPPAPPSTQPRPATNRQLAQARSSPPYFPSSDFDAGSLFDYDEARQSAKRRRLTPEFEDIRQPRRQTPDAVYIYSDDDVPPLHSVNRAESITTTAVKTYKWDGERSDPIVFTSSAPRRRTAEERQKRRAGVVSDKTTTTITIDDDIEEFSDPLALPEDALSCLLENNQTSAKGHLSDRTAALLANLRAESSSGLNGTGTKVSPRGPRQRKKDEFNLDDLLAEEPEEPKKPSKPKRPPKLSAAEKEIKAKGREAAKAQRERDKETEKERKRLEKEEKAKEKQKAADIAEVNKLRTDKKVSAPEMIVDIATTFEDTSVGNQVAEFMRHLGVATTFFESTISGLVKWRRKVKATFNEEAGHWEPCEAHIRSEDHVLCMLSAQEFVDMVIDQPSGENREEIETLELHVLKIKSVYPNCKPIYLIEGLTSWMRKNQNSRNRAFQAEVLRQLDNTNSLGDPSQAVTANGSQAKPRKRKAKKPEDTPPVDDDLIEDALLQLQVTYDCLVQHTSVPGESAEWIKIFTENISTVPYRQEREVQNDAAFCMESGQVKTGEDKADTFVKMLQEVTRVTAPMAYGIASRYPSVTDLLVGMREHGSSMLEDVRKSANKNGALTDSRIGPAVSRRLYKVFMGLDPSSVDI